MIDCDTIIANAKTGTKVNSRPRTGCVYYEFTSKGRCSLRFTKGCAPIKCGRWVAEICIYGKRYRCRSSKERNVRAWLADMVEKYGNL